MLGSIDAHILARVSDVVIPGAALIRSSSVVARKRRVFRIQSGTHDQVANIGQVIVVLSAVITLGSGVQACFSGHSGAYNMAVGREITIQRGDDGSVK